MLRKTFVVIIAMAMVAGCAGLPSICDEATDSHLCEVADGMHMRLEDVGNMLIITNAIAIGKGAYTTSDALGVLHTVRDAAESRGMTYAMFVSIVGDSVSRYPGLFEVFQIYFNQLVSQTVISETDSEILVGWLDRQIESLEASDASGT